MTITVWKRTTTLLAAGGFLVAIAAAPAAADDAKALYEKQCVSCHGAAGHGDGPAGKMLKPPPESFAKALAHASEADIIKIIKEGGKAVGKAPTMPAYGSKLTDEQITGIARYIQELK